MSAGKKITEISAGDRATELQQLLEITSELGTLGDLDEFLQRFVIRAAEFLRFKRAAVAIAVPSYWIAAHLSGVGLLALTLSLAVMSIGVVVAFVLLGELDADERRRWRAAVPIGRAAATGPE